ncbi:hypothetical protein D3C80_1599970 [compost metagenome]
MPGVWFSTWVTLLSCWSSMRWRVITLMDCGVSRIDRFILVAVLVTPVVYDPVPSVVSPNNRELIDVAPSSSAPLCSAACISR